MIQFLIEYESIHPNVGKQTIRFGEGPTTKHKLTQMAVAVWAAELVLLCFCAERFTFTQPLTYI